MGRFGTLKRDMDHVDSSSSTEVHDPARAGTGTKNAREQVVSHCALLAEPDQALRDLMRRALIDASYEVVDSANAQQLEAVLMSSMVSDAKTTLFVLGARLASECSSSIIAAVNERARGGLPPAQAILTFEFGTLATLPWPALAPCVTRGTLEKPFDLWDLQAIALECRHLTTSGANGEPAWSCR